MPLRASLTVSICPLMLLKNFLLPSSPSSPPRPSAAVWKTLRKHERWEELEYVKQKISSPQNIQTYLNRGGVGLIPEGCVGCRLHWRYHPFCLLFQEIYLKLQINDKDWRGFQHFNSIKSITNNTGHRSQVMLPSTGWWTCSASHKCWTCYTCKPAGLLLAQNPLQKLGKKERKNRELKQHLKSF